MKTLKAIALAVALLFVSAFLPSLTDAGHAPQDHDLTTRLICTHPTAIRVIAKVSLGGAEAVRDFVLSEAGRSVCHFFPDGIGVKFDAVVGEAKWLGDGSMIAIIQVHDASGMDLYLLVDGTAAEAEAQYGGNPADKIEYAI